MVKKARAAKAAVDDRSHLSSVCTFSFSSCVLAMEDELLRQEASKVEGAQDTVDFIEAVKKKRNE